MNNAWIVISGTLLDTAKGGGFEFFGPFKDQESAKAYSDSLWLVDGGLKLAVQLLKP